MNQDQIKEKLLLLDDSAEDFTVILTGKSSRRVDGQYHPDRREIILHNKNFTGDNALMYTAIHEFAHHLHFSRSPVPISTRAHTNRFWSILHKLLFDAERKGIYTNIFERDQRFLELTERIRGNFLSANGQLMKELGGLLMEAQELCEKSEASFDDYVDRVLHLHRTAAKTVMRVYAMNVSPEIGFENMKTVAGIGDHEKRKMAEDAFLKGDSPDMVKAEFATRIREEDTLDRLESERRRIERTIESLATRLTEIERRIEELRR